MGIGNNHDIFSYMETYCLAKKWVDAVRSEIELTLHKYKITFKQWQILHIIGNHNINTPTGIAQHLSADKPSITRSTDYLVENLFLKRNRGVDDRRTIQLLLTDEGIMVMELGHSALQGVPVKFKSGLTKSEAKKISKLEDGYFINCNE